MMFIDSSFLVKLASADLPATVYKLALCFPKLLCKGQLDCSNTRKIAKVANISQTSVRRALKTLEDIFVIIPSKETPGVYHCNPYLIWDGTLLQPEYESAYKRWNKMVGPLILAKLEKSKQLNT